MLNYKTIATTALLLSSHLMPARTDVMSTRPNILFIMTDQQYAGMMSCTGNKYVNTPTLDSLAARGVRFEKAYSPNPVCVPSRTSMMTGYYPSAFGFSSNPEADKAVIPQNVLDNTLGKLFRKAGYTTMYGGKTHWAKGLNLETIGFEDLTRDERDQLAEKAAGFLRSQPKEPFLLVTSFINPHDICFVELEATAAYYGLPEVAPKNSRERKAIAEAVRLAEKAREDGTFEKLCPPLKKNFEQTQHLPDMLVPKKVIINKDEPVTVYKYMNEFVRTVWTAEDWRMHHWIYRKLTEDVDRQIGIVLDALKESGLYKNTYVVFLSDHGDMDGSHKMVHKSMFYEEAARVPFLIAGPGVVKKVDNDHLLSASVDLLPTLCGLAGIRIPEGIHGRSIAPLVMGNRHSEWRDFVISETANGRMVRSAKYKYILFNKGEQREMLLDMEKDPGEMINLAVNPAFQKVLKEHREMLKSWVKKTKDPIAMEYVNL